MTDELNSALEASLSEMDTVAESLLDPATAASEVALDKLLAPAGDVVQAIPVLGLTVGAVRGGIAISNLLLAKKIFRMLVEVRSVSKNEREKVLQKLDANEKNRTLSGVLLALNKADDMLKARYIGRLFAAFLREQLTQAELFTLLNAINVLSIDALHHASAFYGDIEARLDDAYWHPLASAQIVTISYAMIGTFGGGGPQLERNDLGRKLVQAMASK